MRKKTMLIISISFVLFIGVAALSWYILFTLRGVNPPLGKSVLHVGSAAFDVEIANTTTTRARGLSGRESLAENEGMLFIFNSPGIHGFWMKDMKFPIDFVWIRGDKVVGVTENAAPEPGVAMWNLTLYYPPEDVTHVLEVPAGTVEKRSIKMGDSAIMGK